MIFYATDHTMCTILPMTRFKDVICLKVNGGLSVPLSAGNLCMVIYQNSCYVYVLINPKKFHFVEIMRIFVCLDKALCSFWLHNYACFDILIPYFLEQFDTGFLF
ncbi:hypothetical protein DITRI_Ditri15bG0020000 [Diplodiscus trichospermus]